SSMAIVYIPTLSLHVAHTYMRRGPRLRLHLQRGRDQGAKGAPVPRRRQPRLAPAGTKLRAADERSSPRLIVRGDLPHAGARARGDRKSTRLKSSHVKIYHAVF